MSRTYDWKVEAEHPRRKTNAIEVVRAATEENAIAGFRRRQGDLHPNNFGPVTDEWPIVSVTRLDDGWYEAGQVPESRPAG